MTFVTQPKSLPPPLHPTSGLTAETARPWVLVVDDREELTRLARYLLERIPGARVDTSNDPHAAPALWARRAYDVAVLDLEMPGRCGLSLARQLRAEGRPLPVVIWTATPARVDTRVQIDLAPLTVVSKSSPPQLLIDAVRRAWSAGE